MRRRLTGPTRKNNVIGRTALAALCVLGLAACGTARAGDTESERAAVRAENRSTASPAAPASKGAAETEGADFLPFMELLLDIAEPCLPSDPPTATPPEELEAESAEEREPRGTASPEEPLPLPDDPIPTSAPRDPEDAKKETELSSVEKCEAPLHVDRITKALKKTPDPTPAQVTGTLHDLGYIEERVHTPRHASDHVEFTLDLRLMDGQLCLSGTTTGTRTTIEAYGGSPEVECQDVRRTS
ncbi:hypothetical protein QF037_005798 [Streptomyces canus]|uniref:hypothetical protein n=1 Tax=Streptomyces canus TaxID=58343 RepID=UPI00278B5F2B|nr:hypothetical protein [Streptomyces canus]MDQ0601453.1 hypothetical protein [Streptomyces canus]